MKIRNHLATGLIGILAMALTGAAQVTKPRDSGSLFLPPGSELLQGSARLDCSFLQHPDCEMLTARVQGAGRSGVRLFMQLGYGPLDLSAATSIGFVPTDAEGNAETTHAYPLPAGMADCEISVHAVYWDGGRLHVSEPAPFLRNPSHVRLVDFDRAPGAPGTAGRPARLPAGLVVDEQWAAMGVHVSATNNVAWHPHEAILYDSGDQFGMDPDLTTPGVGFMNDQAHGNLLVVARDVVDVDGDGLVDYPDDEREGGVISFAFDEPLVPFEIVLVDVDELETVMVRCYLGEALVQDVRVPAMGDNGVERVGLASERATRLDVVLGGSGGIAELSFLGRPEVRSGGHVDVFGAPRPASVDLAAPSAMLTKPDGNTGVFVLGGDASVTLPGPRTVPVQPDGNVGVFDAPRPASADLAAPSAMLTKPDGNMGVFVLGGDASVTLPGPRTAPVLPDGNVDVFGPPLPASADLAAPSAMLTKPDGNTGVFVLRGDASVTLPGPRAVPVRPDGNVGVFGPPLPASADLPAPFAMPVRSDGPLGLFEVLRGLAGIVLH